MPSTGRQDLTDLRQQLEESRRRRAEAQPQPTRSAMERLRELTPDVQLFETGSEAP